MNIVNGIDGLGRFFTYWCSVGSGWEWGNGMIITSDYGSFPHSLLSTSKRSTKNKLEVSINGATPKLMVYNGKSDEMI